MIGSLGWQTYTVLNPDSAKQEMCGQTVAMVETLPKQLEVCGLPKSACLGVLGLPGLSAYSALLHACRYSTIGIFHHLVLSIISGPYCNQY